MIVKGAQKWIHGIQNCSLFGFQFITEQLTVKPRKPTWHLQRRAQIIQMTDIFLLEQMSGWQEMEQQMKHLIHQPT